MPLQVTLWACDENCQTATGVQFTCTADSLNSNKDKKGFFCVKLRLASRIECEGWE